MDRQHSRQTPFGDHVRGGHVQRAVQAPLAVEYLLSARPRVAAARSRCRGSLVINCRCRALNAAGQCDFVGRRKQRTLGHIPHIRVDRLLVRVRPVKPLAAERRGVVRSAAVPTTGAGVQLRETCLVDLNHGLHYLVVMSDDLTAHAIADAICGRPPGHSRCGGTQNSANRSATCTRCNRHAKSAGRRICAGESGNYPLVHCGSLGVRSRTRRLPWHYATALPIAAQPRQSDRRLPDIAATQRTQETWLSRENQVEVITSTSTKSRRLAASSHRILQTRRSMFAGMFDFVP